jgi:hypothetical protein
MTSGWIGATGRLALHVVAAAAAAAMAHTLRQLPPNITHVIWGWGGLVLVVSVFLALKVRRRRQPVPSPFVTWLPVIGFFAIVAAATTLR